MVEARFMIRKLLAPKAEKLLLIPARIPAMEVMTRIRAVIPRAMIKIVTLARSKLLRIEESD
jgi:hypothetical protein